MIDHQLLQLVAPKKEQIEMMTPLLHHHIKCTAGVESGVDCQKVSNSPKICLSYKLGKHGIKVMELSHHWKYWSRWTWQITIVTNAKSRPIGASETHYLQHLKWLCTELNIAANIMPRNTPSYSELVVLYNSDAVQISFHHQQLRIPIYVALRSWIIGNMLHEKSKKK